MQHYERIRILYNLVNNLGIKFATKIVEDNYLIRGVVMENDENSFEMSEGRRDMVSDSETVGNRRDETQIISDQDMTNEGDITALDENMGAKTNSLDSLEDEPADFVTGEIDVKEQMDRTTRAMDDAIERSSGRRSHVKRDTYSS